MGSIRQLLSRRDLDLLMAISWNHLELLVDMATGGLMRGLARPIPPAEVHGVGSH